MKKIKYIRHEAMGGPSSRVEADLAHFILDIPYMMYFGVIPSRDAINQRLRDGGSHGGMSPGAEWKPFEISEEEYIQIVDCWREMDIQSELARGGFRYDPKEFILDVNIINEPDHLSYLRKSREKYETNFFPELGGQRFSKT